MFLSLYLLILWGNLELGTHGVGGDGAQVENGHWLTGVDWLGAELQVGVAQHTTDGLGVADLGAWVQVVLAAHDLIWAELTKVLGGHNLTRNQAS